MQDFVFKRVYTDEHIEELINRLENDQVFTDENDEINYYDQQQDIPKLGPEGMEHGLVPTANPPVIIKTWRRKSNWG